jgi:hypothetical protein
MKVSEPGEFVEPGRASPRNTGEHAMTHDPAHQMPEPTLGVTMLRPADGDALDAWIDRIDRDAAPADARQARVAGWMALVGHDPVSPAPADLSERTLQRIDEARQRERFAQQIAMLRRDVPGRGFGFQWRELATAAAVILIGLSLAIPVLDRGRADARRIACSSNFAAAGMGLNQYAQNHAGVMPRMLAEPGEAWWHVGEQVKPGQATRSNSAHLFVLVRTRHVKPQTLNCPDNPHAPRRVDADDPRGDWANAAAVSYSYQNQFTTEPIRLDRVPDLVVLADKNPLFMIRVHGLDFDSAAPPTSSSRFHARVGPGQNVLSAAGHVKFTASPVVNRRGQADNIWLLDSRPMQRTYTGNETPTDPDRDAFLVP